MAERIGGSAIRLYIQSARNNRVFPAIMTVDNAFFLSILWGCYMLILRRNRPVRP